MTKPKKQRPIDAASLARGYTETAIRTLGGIMKDGEEEGNRTRAAQLLLERGWGKPAQDNTHSGQLEVIIRKLGKGE